MTGIETWTVFEERLREAKRILRENYTKSPYGDVSILAVGDFCQLPPVMSKGYVFQNIDEDSLEVFSRHIWKDYFYLHELTEIVRQQGDPTYAEVMSRVRV